MEAARSPADRGEAIEVPFLAIRLQGELFRADWTLSPEAAILSEADLSFRRDEEVLVVDMEREHLRYSRAPDAAPALPGLPGPPDTARKATLIQWLTRQCRAPDRIDPGLNPEELACAQALDALPQVALWTRNPARHRARFWLPTTPDRFYPDLLARLTDGCLFVVEYKGEHLATAADTREKAQIGELWARRTGNLFAKIEVMKHGEGPEAQLRRVLSPPH